MRNGQMDNNLTHSYCILQFPSRWFSEKRTIRQNEDAWEQNVIFIIDKGYSVSLAREQIDERAASALGRILHELQESPIHAILFSVNNWMSKRVLKQHRYYSHVPVREREKGLRNRKFALASVTRCFYQHHLTRGDIAASGRSKCQQWPDQHWCCVDSSTNALTFFTHKHGRFFMEKMTSLEATLPGEFLS